MSIEALAMAGADYIKCGFDLQELEKTPPHLLAEQRPRNDQCQEDERVDEEMKAFSLNLFLLQISGLERITNDDSARK